MIFHVRVLCVCCSRKGKGLGNFNAMRKRTNQPTRRGKAPLCSDVYLVLQMDRDGASIFTIAAKLGRPADAVRAILRGLSRV